MRFVTFNANGIRARLHQIEAITESHAPDVIALQETKVMDDMFPLETVQAMGYPHIVIHGQKGHYGVALLSKSEPTEVQCGFPWREADQQRRFVTARYEIGGRRVRVINGYFPQGESRDHAVKFPAKRLYYQDLLRYLRERCDPGESLVLSGDMNVAPQDRDIGIGEDNAKRWLREGKTSFLPEEREWLEAVMAWGFTDVYATRTADADRLYSWFDYRSRGFDRDPQTRPSDRPRTGNPKSRRSRGQLRNRLRNPRRHKAVGPLPGVVQLQGSLGVPKPARRGADAAR